jgi:prepilin-type N-terminal cleavage/methylation domain-containing protein
MQQIEKQLHKNFSNREKVKVAHMNKRSAFTLIELLLAIFIVSLFAYIVFATPQSYQKPKERVTVSNLPSYFQKNLHGDGELVCINKCKECYYLSGSSKPQSAPIPIPLDVIDQYTLDRNGNPQKLDLGRYKDSRVCMRFRHYKNGSISQLILELKEKTLFIPSYFGEGKSFDSVDQAASWWLEDTQNGIKSKGEWY